MTSRISGQLIAEGSLATHLDLLRRDRRVDQDHRRFRQAHQLSLRCGPASSLRALCETVAEPMSRVLGFQPRAVRIEPVRVAGVPLSCAVIDTAGAGGPGSPDGLVDADGAGRPGGSGAIVPWVVALWATPLDPLWRTGVVAARLAGSRWAFVINGTHLRLLDAASGPVRRWIQVDLDQAADDRMTFATLWLVARAATLADRLAELVEQSDAFATGLCRSLREGVLSASEEVLGTVVGRRKATDLPAALEQALVVVYRIVFLLFAESRSLVPMWHPTYRRGYSIDALRRAVERGSSRGVWDTLRAISLLAHAGYDDGALRVTPFNGRLFDGHRTPFVSRRDLDDRTASRALLALTTRVSRVRGGREPIAYGDLGVEQLGAVYETLLDYEPRWIDGRPRLQHGSDARKASGAFYTPEPIARYLVARTLRPLVEGRSPEEILRLRVLDPSMGSGAFLVTACLYLADAYEQALGRSGNSQLHDLGDQDRAGIRRTIAERCLYGVDLNPMAVQLGRLSLWLATLAGDRPLSFLDHHIRVGDSLLGAWTSMLSRPPRTGRRPRDPDAPSLFEPARLAAAARALLPARFALSGPGETLDAVRRKERTLLELEREGSVLDRWRRVADVWCAAWFNDVAASARTFAALTDAILEDRHILPAHVAARQLQQTAAIAAARRFFHWELEFPEVFFDDQGQRRSDAGFDAVIGNPPWDMVRGDSGGRSNRQQARDAAGHLLRFARDAGVYEVTPRGHINRYQLFLERSIALLREGGRCGMVLPGGLLSDHGSAPLRRLLFNRCAVDGLVSFDNRRGVFPIHRTMRFVLATATKGTPTGRFGIRLGEVDPTVLQGDDSGAAQWFPVQVSRELLARLSGDGLAVPDVRTAFDLALLERVTARHLPLGSTAGWGVEFGRELNATDDRALLRPPGDGLPVVEGKQLLPFAVQSARASHAIRAGDAASRLGAVVTRQRLAYRDVASASNRQTLIAALLPAGCASTHTIFCLKTPLPAPAQHYLCGLFNSYVLNYFVRQRVTTHVTTAIVERLPIPLAAEHPVSYRRIRAIARRLTRLPQDDLTWSLLLDDLNASVAALYRLSVDEYAYVLSTFPLVPREERARALAAYRGNWT